MAMKKILLLTIILSLQIKYVSAQQSLSKEKVEELTALSKKIEGTYQVQIINSREMASIPIELMQIIEDKRQDIDTVYFPIKTNIQLMILPKKLILKPGFQKIEQIKHINKAQ